MLLWYLVIFKRLWDPCLRHANGALLSDLRLVLLLKQPTFFSNHYAEGAGPTNIPLV